MRDARADLVAHCGGRPSATQRRLIEVAARLTLFVATLDAKASTCLALSAGEADAYARACEALTGTLRDLGVQGTAAQPPAPSSRAAGAAAA